MLVKLLKGLAVLIALGWIPPLLIYFGVLLTLGGALDGDRNDVIAGLLVLLAAYLSILLVFDAIEWAVGG